MKRRGAIKVFRQGRAAWLFARSTLLIVAIAWGSALAPKPATAQFMPLLMNPFAADMVLMMENMPAGMMGGGAAHSQMMQSNNSMMLMGESTLTGSGSLLEMILGPARRTGSMPSTDTIAPREGPGAGLGRRDPGALGGKQDDLLAATEMAQLGGVNDLLVGACAGGAVIGIFSALTAVPIAGAVAATLGANLTAAAGSIGIGCGLGVATVAASVGSVYAFRTYFP